LKEREKTFVQEPYEYQNKPAGIDKKYRTFTAGQGKHRAAIVIPNNKLDAILITQISDEDTAFYRNNSQLEISSSKYVL
jgi:hypothetical protein